MREYWVKMLTRLADPVLDTFVSREKKMPVAGNEGGVGAPSLRYGAMAGTGAERSGGGSAA